MESISTFDSIHEKRWNRPKVLVDIHFHILKLIENGEENFIGEKHTQDIYLFGFVSVPRGKLPENEIQMKIVRTLLSNFVSLIVELIIL